MSRFTGLRNPSLGGEGMLTARTGSCPRAPETDAVVHHG